MIEKTMIPLREGELSRLITLSTRDNIVRCSFGPGLVSLIAEDSMWAVHHLAEWRGVTAALNAVEGS